jgi:hypothetical protein
MNISAFPFLSYRIINRAMFRSLEVKKAEFGFNPSGKHLGPWSCQVCEPTDHREAKTVLGIPPDSPTVVVSVSRPFNWPGYYFDCFGTYATPEDPPDAPRIWLYGHENGGSVTPNDPPKASDRVFNTLNLYDGSEKVLIAWQRRVVCWQIPPWLEARWHPSTGVTIDLCMVENAKTTDTSELLSKGQLLLHTFRRIGRSMGSSAIPQEEFCQQYPQAYTDLYYKSGDRPSRLSVAAHLGISERTFRRYLKKDNLPWPPA